MRIVFPRAPRSGGRRENGIEAAAGVQPQAPPSLPGMALLLSSRLEGRSRILPLVFRESLTAFINALQSRKRQAILPSGVSAPG